MKKQVKKRNGEIVLFNPANIVVAIEKSMSSIGNVWTSLAIEVAENVEEKLWINKDSYYIPTVDTIHDFVEKELMRSDLSDVAKSYIIYRNQNKPGIFRKRTNLKPYEYPELEEYVNSIRHSYWIHDEFNYTSDIQDINVSLSTAERQAVVRAMLAISQIEVSVKTFWGEIYGRMPKPEIGSVGATFSESEVRHADAYSNLIKLLGLNDEFEELLDVPAIRRRIKYLERAITNSKLVDNKEYFESIILFSIFVENVSLFSQFLVIMAFNKHKNYLKGMSNVVEATSKEEQIHADFGFDLINTIKKENPDWWTTRLQEEIKDACLEAYDAELGIIDWIFESGDLDFLSKKETIAFIENRFNTSMKQIGITPQFTPNAQDLLNTEWFDDEVMVTKHTDFFNKRSINYTKRQKSITKDDLF